MNIKNLAKKTGKFIVYAALINQLGKPLMQPIVITSASYLISAKKEAINELKTNYFFQEEARSKKENLSALEYLNLASYLTNKYKENSDVCRHMANSTFDLFEEFVKKDNRKDLEKKIRLCGGEDIRIGHMWIEYKKDDKWIPYETTDFVGNYEVFIRNLKNYSEENPHSKLNFNHKDFETIPGTKIFYPTSGSLKGVGLMGVLIGGINQTFGGTN